MPPIKGMWLAKTQGQEPYVGAAKWGTGINPVHAVRGGAGREIATSGTTNVLPDELAPKYEYGYCAEDTEYALYGYGVETGTKDRASWGDDENRTDVIPGFPQWGPYEGGAPGGQGIRTIEHGAVLTNTMKVEPDDTWAQGWVNKDTSFVNDPSLPEPEQLTRQTSMQQLRRTRAGSQRGTSQSDYDQPIATRVPGMIRRTYSGGQRHADMEPKAQDIRLRPFWNRTAGTGPVENMQTNELYVSEPFQRTPPPNAYTGPDAGGQTDAIPGYVSEDVTW